MAEILERQLVRVRNFVVGADTYRGITQIRYTKRGPAYLQILQEGENTPTVAPVEVESTQATVNGSIRSKSATSDNLVGLTEDECSAEAFDAVGKTWVRATFANPRFEQSDGSAGNTQVEGYSLNFTATAVTLADVAA